MKEKKTIAGRTIEQWYSEYPLLREITATKEVFWINPQYEKEAGAKANVVLDEKDVLAAEERLTRFASYIAKVFPETRAANGIIESPLVEIPGMKKEIERLYGQIISGALYIKKDSHLPIAGSIKARGGIYAVLKIAEELAWKSKMLTATGDYAALDGDPFRRLFSRYSIVVGSTGNLGLSIGIMSAQLGFKATVHMSADAKKWKKDLLRAKGVNVVEHSSDYTRAVEMGREQALKDLNSFFIDDENSVDLFLGYAVAAGRFKEQLNDSGVIVDEKHPLFVYLPCGVGGGPGGITYGLKLQFKENVHCFFAEPTHSPAMLVGLLTGLHEQTSVQEFGIDNITEADGLAVGRPSGLVGKMLADAISGVYTVGDDQLYILLKTMAEAENTFLEPSAVAGFDGPAKLFKSAGGQEYLKAKNLRDHMNNATHIVWATGGSMVPGEIMESFYNKGKAITGAKKGK